MASDIIPISSVTHTAPPAAAAPSNTLDKDAFLKLLVAQLKYQNPMSPTDPSQFMAQSAQFTMVEKLSQMTDVVTKQAALAGEMSAVGLIGKAVTTQSPDGGRTTGTVTAVRFTSDGPLLRIGDRELPMTSILDVGRTDPGVSATG